jgi:hypothetical protein
MSQNIISDTEMKTPKPDEWSGEIEVRFMSMLAEPIESKMFFIREKLTFEEIENALNTYIRFKHAKRGRKPKYHPDCPPSEWLLDHDLKRGHISKSTYHRYKKLISENSEFDVKDEMK